MAQNFLYMFEFVVDDLLVTRPNHCAPEEYPTCCEISFRNSVFVSICDREYGHCVNPNASKCGKSCIFSLDKPLQDDDRLMIHVYKKKTENCKFLIGCTDMPIRGLFDKVMENFNIKNPNWLDLMRRHLQTMPQAGACSKVVDNDCDEEASGRREQLCPTSELTKRLLPIFNLKGSQTGNIVMIIRLVANGPTMVFPFPYSKGSKARCNSKSKVLQSPNDECVDTSARRVGGGNDSSVDEDGPEASKACEGSKTEKQQVCQRYFACNADKGYPCDVVEDECSRAPKCKQLKCHLKSCRGQSSCSHTSRGKSATAGECSQTTEGAGSCDESLDACEEANSCDDINSCDPCDVCLQPCFVTPRKPEPGPDAYDEFEACLNGSGMVIRVLKDTHCVENIRDGTEEFHTDRENGGCCEKDNNPGSALDVKQLLQTNSFARNHMKRHTGGHIINHPKLPQIRANIKYAGNDTCGSMERYYVPYSKIKDFCNDKQNKIESYRSRRDRDRAGGDNGTVCPPLHPSDNRNCCVQVDGDDIRNAMRGMDNDMRKKGIEVCYKTCDDTDTDVFLVKLGSKQKCQHKKNNIEIELRTPKQPIVLQNRKVTTETQIDEVELDAALAGVCRGKKGKKGKKAKK
ncbi:uncharacterized protein LOC106094572 isoform X2 [Stomoxys calcitrans]|uniref:uncharacterized protein LOC106094572 isoform X2 n=1 Tax=Stomoxys calcitrans TaxID=35570 RepID=UPI0027E2BC1D|nr:uncharacterized protein LOC106094572 isoform X2 [Stomoxys calcitrans]